MSLHCDVVRYRHRAVERARLRYVDEMFERCGCERLAVDAYRARRWFEKSENRLNRRRFPGTVGTE